MKFRETILNVLLFLFINPNLLKYILCFYFIKFCGDCLKENSETLFEFRMCFVELLKQN